MANKNTLIIYKTQFLQFFIYANHRYSQNINHAVQILHIHMANTRYVWQMQRWIGGGGRAFYQLLKRVIGPPPLLRWPGPPSFQKLVPFFRLYIPSGRPVAKAGPLLLMIETRFLPQFPRVAPPPLTKSWICMPLQRYWYTLKLLHLLT